MVDLSPFITEKLEVHRAFCVTKCDQVCVLFNQGFNLGSIVDPCSS